MTFLVRAMRESDVEQVLSIASDLSEAPHWPRSAYCGAINSENSPQRIALVAQDAAGIVGFVVAMVMAPQAELESVAVPSFAQRRGIATGMLRELTSHLIAESVDELLLELRSSNSRAAGFYEQYGFVSVGRRRSYYQDPVEDALLLKLDLKKIPS